MRIREIAQARSRFDCLGNWIVLRREGWPDNKQRVHRLYYLEGLQLRLRPRRKKCPSRVRGRVPPAQERDQRWSMNVVHDELIDGRAFRVLTVIDQWSCESVLMEVKAGLTGQCVADALEAASAHRSLPKTVTVDHGTKFTSVALDAWAHRRGVTLDFIRSGKPVDNACIDSFNGRLRNECIIVQRFTSIAHAQDVIEQWRCDDNNRRPHGALGFLTPRKYATQGQQQGSKAAAL